MLVGSCCLGIGRLLLGRAAPGGADVSIVPERRSTQIEAESVIIDVVSLPDVGNYSGMVGERGGML